MARRTSPNLILVNGERTWKLSELSKKLPDEPTYGTLWDWVARGVEVEGRKEKVRLEAILRPRGLHSSLEAYERFIEKLNGG